MTPNFQFIFAQAVHRLATGPAIAVGATIVAIALYWLIVYRMSR
jgi:hypothetical protein